MSDLELQAFAHPPSDDEEKNIVVKLIDTAGALSFTSKTPKSELEVLQEKAQREIDALDLTKNVFGITENAKTFKTYLRIVIIALIITMAGFTVMSFLQVFIPTFTFSASLVVIWAFWAGSEFIWLFDHFVIPDKDLSDRSLLSIIALVFYIGTIVLYWIMLFFVMTELSWITLLIIYLAVWVWVFGTIAIIYLGKNKMERSRDFATKITVTALILTSLIIHYSNSLFDCNIGSIIYAHVVSLIALSFLYVDKVVEMMEGVTGTYDKFKVVTIVSTLSRLIFACFFIFTLIFQTIKNHGLSLIWITLPVNFSFI